jgi:hypothetical protein
MMCNHSISDQDIAIIADGMCPLCQAIEIERLRAENKRLRAVLKGGWSTLALLNVKNYHHTLVALQAQLLAGLEQKSDEATKEEA